MYQIYNIERSADGITKNYTIEGFMSAMEANLEADELYAKDVAIDKADKADKAKLAVKEVEGRAQEKQEQERK